MQSGEKKDDQVNTIYNPSGVLEFSKLCLMVEKNSNTVLCGCMYRQRKYLRQWYYKQGRVKECKEK